MGDFIKGKKYEEYDPEISKGVLLHREIDHFTDANEVVTLSKIRLREAVSHYAGVVVDIFYDHFLVKNWENFSTVPLNIFVEQIYTVVKKYESLLPIAGKYVIPYMIEHNWLINYGNFQGVERSLKGISKRSKFHPPLVDAMVILKKNYDKFNIEFLKFFPQLVSYTSKIKNELAI